MVAVQHRRGIGRAWGEVKLRERTEIARLPADVWPFIVTAELFRQWNEKIVDIEATGQFRQGQSFITRYRMSGREMQCLSKVIALEPGLLLELRHGNCSGKGMRRELDVVERITLSEKRGRTIVKKEVDLRNSGLPWFMIPVLWFINRFGKPVGRNKLKDLCEGRIEK